MTALACLESDAEIEIRSDYRGQQMPFPLLEHEFSHSLHTVLEIGKRSGSGRTYSHAVLKEMILSAGGMECRRTRTVVGCHLPVVWGSAFREGDEQDERVFAGDATLRLFPTHLQAAILLCDCPAGRHVANLICEGRHEAKLFAFGNGRKGYPLVLESVSPAFIGVDYLRDGALRAG